MTADPTQPGPAGDLFIVSAPSGAGKTSLVKALLEQEARIAPSVSHTTRDRRPGEVEGRDYFFVDVERFQAMTRADDFLEHAEVFGNFYGTAKSQVDAKLAADQDVVLDIDWQGARQIRACYPGAISIFVLPPSLPALRARLVARGEDSAETIDRRMQAARAEISHAAEYDFLIVNDVFERALEDLTAVVRASRFRLAAEHLGLAAVIARVMASEG